MTALMPPIAAVRSARSIGVAWYVDRLAGALAEIGVDYRPCARASRGSAAHLHLANSSRGVLWGAATSPSPLLTLHDVVPRTNALLPGYRRLVYPLLRRAAVTIVHSRFAADLLRRMGGEGKRVEVIPHPVATFASLDREAARRALGWEGDTPVFVLPGVLKSSKLVAEVLAAAGPLLERGRLRLALVGSISDEAVAARARALGVDVLASPGRSSYEQAIVAADCVLVLRERSVGETNGPLLDALGAGRAVLATAVGSIPEVAGDAALYCGPSEAEIRASLTILCDGDELALRAANSRARAGAFSGSIAAAAHARLFREVLDG
jgi:glycosyltransferase involved in cell wall biosynthesis